MNKQEMARAEERWRLVEVALEALLKRYLSLVNSGNCGFWDPEKEDEVIQARVALKTR